MCGASAMESLIRDHSLVASSPPQAGDPQTQAGNKLYAQSRGDPDYTHTYNEQHTRSSSGKCHLGESQREGGILSAPGSGGGV